MADVVVLGQIGCDLVLRIAALPEAGGAAPVSERRELLGGKGANQAVALTQLGVPTALVGVVGDDHRGVEARAQADVDGIDVSAMVRRSAAATALLVDLVEDGGRRRLLEHVPADVLLTAADVVAAADQLASCQLLSLQLQQPGEAVRAALEQLPAGRLVATDGAPADDATRDAVLARADIVRADAAEAALLVGREISGVEDAREATAELLTHGPRLVALELGREGNLVAWRAGPPLGVAAEELEAAPEWADGEILIPLLDDTVDPTGGGDAFVAALVATLLGGAGPEDAAWAAAAAAAITVKSPGGRPALRPAALGEAVRRYRAAGSAVG